MSYVYNLGCIKGYSMSFLMFFSEFLILFKFDNFIERGDVICVNVFAFVVCLNLFLFKFLLLLFWLFFCL